MDNYGTKHSFVLSNIPGFVKPLHLCGHQLQRMWLIPSGMGTMASGILLFSVMDRLSCTIASDELQIKDFDLFLTIFNRKIKEHGLEFTDK